MAVTGMANLAVKVADLDAAVAYYEAAGAEVRDRMRWGGGERADVFLGPVMITLFTRAIYEDAVDLPPRGSCTRRSSPTTSTPRSRATPWWGPAVVEGPFGTRRIAFVEAPGGIRLEFMEVGPAAGRPEPGVPDTDRRGNRRIRAVPSPGPGRFPAYTPPGPLPGRRRGRPVTS